MFFFDSFNEINGSEKDDYNDGFIAITSRFINKFISVVLVICLFPCISSAQLEFSNWIVGANTILHINTDGTAELKTYNGIANNAWELLSTRDGNPIIKIGYKTGKYDGYGFSGDNLTFNTLDGNELFVDLHHSNCTLPFLLKSPDNKFVYAIYSTYAIEYEYSGGKAYYKTQVRCYCKNNFDDTDKGEDFLLHEFTGYMDDNTLNLYPFFCGFSHTDGESVWVVTQLCRNDSIISINVLGGKIIKKKKSFLNIPEGSLVHYSPVDQNRIVDNGKVYSYKNGELLVLSFDQDKGIFTNQKTYKSIVSSNFLFQVSSTGKYFYFIRSVNKQTKLFRISFADFDKELYDNAEEIEIKTTQNLYRICIGIDGNIYICTSKQNSILVVHDSESDKPVVETLYENIPDFNFRFPYYLYPFELFSCKTNCDRKATFSFPDKRNEIASYEWNFGDGEKSTEKSPKHTYKKSGSYNVSLVVVLKNGYKKTIPTRTINISTTEIPTPQIIPE